MTEGLEVAVDGGTLAAWRLGEAPTPGPPDRNWAPARPAAPAAPEVREVPEVLAIHGITSTSRAWLAVAAALGDRARLLAPDLRGRGASNPVGPPFGLDAHVADMLAVLDAAGLERPVIAGHSLGAYIACRFAVTHPDRVTRLVLVDGGLPIPDTDRAADPRADIEAFLGPVVQRLRTEFPDGAAYREWWGAHPAFAGSDVDPAVLDAYAAYDLCGEAPHLGSSVNPQVVGDDGGDLFVVTDAHRLSCDAVLLHAPFGLTGEPPPMQPAELVAAWAAGDPVRRRAVRVSGTNHNTIAMGAAGAAAVAREIAGAAGALT